MPAPQLAEGFYWVRYDDRVFVAERFAGEWWEPGSGVELSGRRVDLMSSRLEPPTLLVPIPKAARGRTRPSRSNTP